MRSWKPTICLIVFIAGIAFPQSGRIAGYSESPSASGKYKDPIESNRKRTVDNEDEVVRIETDLLTLPVRVRTKGGRPVPDLVQKEFKIFENGIEQEIAYFSNEEQPFTVALMLDMSYSSVFKLQDIQKAALSFIAQLREHDRVMVVSFDENVLVLCEPTNDRKILHLAVKGSRIGSGTSLYTAIDVVVKEKLRKIKGRKAIVLLSDGVDTSSKESNAQNVEKELVAADLLVYPVRYNTYDDVQKSRKTTAPIQYDENDRAYSTDPRPVKGERIEDYLEAKEFLKMIAGQTGGRVYNVSSTTNLKQTFENIADELRKMYSIGYYPNEERVNGELYEIKVRIYRPDLLVNARPGFSARPR